MINCDSVKPDMSSSTEIKNNMEVIGDTGKHRFGGSGGVQIPTLWRLSEKEGEEVAEVDAGSYLKEFCSEVAKVNRWKGMCQEEK